MVSSLIDNSSYIFSHDGLLSFKGYFQDVIASSKLGSNDNEIQLHPDGTWSTLSSKSDFGNFEAVNKGGVKQKIEVISDDLGKLQKLQKTTYRKSKNVIQHAQK